MRFDGKIAVVTGASLGIGKACALGFAQEGAKVAIIDINEEQGKAAVKEAEALRGEAVFIGADVANEQDVIAMVDGVLERWGRLDILVNNAGIYVQGDVTATEQEEWERVMAVNLRGPFLCTKHAVPAMEKNGGGTVINIASEAGLVGIPGQVAYNVSKGGLIALTRSCAVDLAGRGVRVNCVCPGTTDTPLVKEAINRADDPAAARRRLEEVRPLNRLGKPEEIASAALYLASEAAAYATGSIFSIDGGYTTQ